MDINTAQFRSPNFWSAAYLQSKFGVTRNPIAIVIHDTEGTFPTDAQYLCDANREARTSAHYVVHETEVYELVSPDDAAWHAYVDPAYRRDCPAIRQVIGFENENFQTIGIEISGLRNGAKSDAVYQTVAALVKYLMSRYPGIKADRQHIFGHTEINTDKVDPLPFDWGRFMGLVVPPVDPLAPRLIPQTGHTVQGGFRTLYERYGVDVTGYPLTEEQREDGKTVQYFENVRMEWTPATGARIGALGRLYLALKS